MNFTRTNAEIHFAQRGNARKALRDSAKLKQRLISHGNEQRRAIDDPNCMGTRRPHRVLLPDLRGESPAAPHDSFASTRADAQYLRVGRSFAAFVPAISSSLLIIRFGSFSPARTFVTTSYTIGPKSGLHSIVQLSFPSATACTAARIASMLTIVMSFPG